MTEEELQAIEKRVEAATPGPWTNGVGKVRDGETREVIIGAEGRVIVAMAYGGFGNPTDCVSEDRAFIAHARTDVPALIAEVRKLRDMILADDPLALTPIADRTPVAPPPVPVLDLRHR